MVARSAHPHLYFGPGHIEGLRSKTRHPFFRRDWLAIRHGAEQSLQGSLIAEGWPSKVLPAAASSAARCAFVHRLTGEPQFGERARQICHALLAADGWTGNYLEGVHHEEMQFHLAAAELCRNLALAYDMLAEEMTSAERMRFIRVCREKALEPFLSERSTNAFLYGLRTMNWIAVLAAGAGCLFVALDGDGVDFSKEIDIARAHILRFIEWYDDDGSAVEHGGYWAYGMGNALHLLRALRENGWPRIMQQDSHKLERTAYPILYGCIGGKNVTNFCDDRYGRLEAVARDAALVLAAEFQDGYLQWWAHQLSDAGVLGFVSGDPELEPSPPDELPTCMVFQRTGMGIMRASMTDPDTLYLAIKAGRARGKIFDDPHCQFDLNSVVLDAFGENLLADPGYGHNWTAEAQGKEFRVTDPNHHSNSTPPHNTLLVDGRGQEERFSPIAFLDDFSPSDEIDYVVSRIEQGYGPQLRRFDRHVYFVDKRFFALVDDVELISPGELTWNFHGPKESEISVNDVATIRNGGVRLRIIPVGRLKLSCSRRDDHVLPRLQWDTVAPVRQTLIAWLLLPDRLDDEIGTPSAHLGEDVLLLSDEKGEWHLPIVRRRVPLRTSMTLIRAHKE